MEFSEDLVSWDTEPQYVVTNTSLPVTKEGLDAPLEIEFSTSADRVFLRLQVIPPLSNYEIDSFDVTEEDGTPFAPGRILDLREPAYFQMVLSPQLPSFEAVLPLVWGLVVDDQEVLLDQSNTQFSNQDGKSILQVTVAPEDWSTSSGSSPVTLSSSSKTKASYDTGSTDPAAESNLTDSDAFMDEFDYDYASMEPVISIGRASQKEGDLPLHIDSIRYAGWRRVTVNIAGHVHHLSYTHVVDQADFFYYSGHGHSSDGTLRLEGVRLGPDDVKWDDGLDVVIIAGCSVLDINDYNEVTGSFPPNQHGDPWSRTGPSKFLGYNWEAPSDFKYDMYAPRDILRDWIQRRETDGDVLGWINANNYSPGRNASAIDATGGIGNRVYWYIREETYLGVPLGHFPEDVHESDW